ncbi:MAG: methyltransferase domain-containing protein [Chloroflexota bacterium]
MDKVKQKAQAAWQAADYAKFATSLERGLDDFVPRLSIDKGQSVLDVACGTGNFAMRAAALGAKVTGIDFNPNALAVAEERAEAAAFDIHFDQGDIESMPYPSNSFDWAVSVFGIMFAINSEAAASELTRVIKPRGQYAITSWTPDSLVGDLARTLASYKSAGPGTARTSNWGDEVTILKLLGRFSSELRCIKRMWRYEFPFGSDGVVDFFRRYSGSHIPLFAELDADGKRALSADLKRVWDDHNQATDGTMVADAEYLEVVGTVKT